MFFKIQHIDKKTHARAGVITTSHGEIKTPVFMPVGTQATVKTLDSQDLENLGAEIILGNTYHLHLRPGEDLVESAGGIHGFMNWNKPVLTDSGGFQVFSLGKQKEEKKRGGNNEQLAKITDKGVEFRSHIDGSKHFFSPEESIKIQHKLGADIIMAFDECTPDKADKKYTREALDRTHRWAKQSLEEHERLSVIHSTNSGQAPTEAKRSGEISSKIKGSLDKLGMTTSDQDDKKFLFGIIQGAGHKELREESAKYISSLDFDGIAIGGESVGYNMEATMNILDWVYPIIPKDKPHYAMGLGLNPADLFEVVERGVDMFDCVAPTRLARHGVLYIKDIKNKHRLNITNAKFKNDFAPIDKDCTCSTCQNYSRVYVHHLFDVKEVTAMRLATIHNIHFFLNLMREMREAILEDRFLEMKKEWV